MAKRPAKRSSRRPYDDDDFVSQDMLADDLDEEEDEDEFEDEMDEMDEDDEEEESERRRPVKKRASTSRKRPSENSNKEVRLKAFWGVYSQSFQREDIFEFHEKELAEKRAAELTESKKILHFVKLDKKVIES